MVQTVADTSLGRIDQFAQSKLASTIMHVTPFMYVQCEEMMKTFEIELHSLTATESLGVLLGKIATAGDVICLNGDLGAGKTTLSQYIARGLGVDPTHYVTSPSFAIMQEYPGRIPLYHMDFYRLGSGADVEELGFDEYFYLSGLTLIEWSSIAHEVLPEDRLEIFLTVTSEHGRKATFTVFTDHWLTRINGMIQQVI